ncbi:MAG: SDR family NAD(P)-dependent oxidoreductase [Clostridiaceae bacterium]
MYNLEDKTVLITGAGSGIGRETAYAFGREKAKLILLDKSESGLQTTLDGLKTLGRTARTHVVDVTNEKQVQKAVESVMEEYLLIDVLVNCAGVSTMQWSWAITEEEWDLNMDVNAKGCWLVCKHVLPHMIKRRQGRIVNTASMAGKAGAPLLAHYCASKYAVIGLTESIAKEVAPYGITVNAVCPGYVKTPMQDREVIWEAQLRGIEDPEVVRKEYISLTPLGRLSVPSDIAKSILFLSSDQAEFMTGESIKVSGGQL